jgi:Ran GTPase-activating protein (RanGAP) involved in mRNA processing and transport
MLKAFRRKKTETELEKYVKRLKANDPNLTELDLYNNSIGNDGAKAIAEALKVNTVLTRLDLDTNSIGNDGTKAIAEALKVNTVLTTLSLQSNSIGNDGAKAIAEALKRNTVLTTLNLGYNSIGNDGAKAIAEALKVKTVLTILYLGDNSIGNDGAKAIAEALKDNIFLTRLELSYNSIGDNLRNDINKLIDANINRINLISIGRSKMDEAIDNVNKRPIELPKEFIISCTNNFAALKLGEGAFGAVYKGMDDNRYFAVKCLRFNLTFLEDKKKLKIIKTFKKELEVSSSVVSSIAGCFKSIMFLNIPSYCFRY